MKSCLFTEILHCLLAGIIRRLLWWWPTCMVDYGSVRYGGLWPERGFNWKECGSRDQGCPLLLPLASSESSLQSCFPRPAQPQGHKASPNSSAGCHMSFCPCQGCFSVLWLPPEGLPSSPSVSAAFLPSLSWSDSQLGRGACFTRH